MFGYPDETLSLVFDILLQEQFKLKILIQILEVPHQELLGSLMTFITKDLEGSLQGSLESPSKIF